MDKLLVSVFVGLCLCLISCNEDKLLTSISSPNSINTIQFEVTEDGRPFYRLIHDNKVVIDTSFLGFEFKNQLALSAGLKVVATANDIIRENWKMPWGEQLTVENHYHELVVALEEKAAPHRKMNIYFKVYDDGVGFRYELLPQEEVDSLIIMDELTEFQLTEDHTVWWTPADYDSYEHLYNTTAFSKINAIEKGEIHSLNFSTVPQNAVHTPVTMRSADGLHLSFHEANLTNYASMTLKVDPSNLSMSSELVGSDRFGYKAKVTLPFKTPWRTIQLAEKAGDLIESNLILNLNEPNKLGDVSWFEPKKYVGIWWEMHLGESSWDLASGKHGATTENTKRYIDFAAANGIEGVLVEGWNTGWEVWTDPLKKVDNFDFVTPYPDYDLAGLVAYGKEKEVEIIMHHETSAAVSTYEKHLDPAYDLMQELGIHSVKTGYVGSIVPQGEYHHGQWMVNHYRRVLEIGAEHQVAINAHEPIKPTGLRRTYPNAIAREGLRGQEFNAWASDGGNPPEHLSIVAFTRMLAGPIDFTPGVFDISLPSRENNQVNTTLAHQLALYVVVYSPIQMACDLPENYDGQAAFQFIRDVGVDWQQTKVLNGEVGDFVTIARKERNSDNWFLGSITDENVREIDINFDFLEDGKVYEAVSYRDAEDANYKTNPTAIQIETMEITKGMSKTFTLASGGGLAISLMPKQ